MIIDCPSYELRDLLVTNKDALPQQKPLSLVIHITPQDIIESEPYRSWMNKFGDTTQHILLNKTVTVASNPFQKDAELLSRLHAVSPSIFPDIDLTNSAGKVFTLPSNLIPGHSLLTYHFRPLKKEGLCRQAIPGNYDFEQLKKQAHKQMSTFRSDSVNCHEQMSTFRSDSVNCHEKVADLSGMSDFQLNFLGTGSSTPSIFRNNSAILLHIRYSVCKTTFSL